ncbi:hypothetical protein L226DRAFT_466520 [Lentinus tigrinus ALCF2SS1-7]|uniref:BTB domain-containing protein n=1 Tax=Lentinus tigrinus ALCF2SS1-6 TaxID=1328759 RepID=A0A5C2SBA0_9APHY|nr:hypothetical protein L227DRAFT_505071 [Lentinus tigrinus ALCF2SS1-6]RPD72786.1 hypothetical protein L226DRAFT_466520 [Lentinus tigrinus ALCF2SS1-7]
MAEDEQRPLKRPRTLASNGSEEKSSLPSPGSATIVMERDEEFWLDDGNVVLVAQSTGFRVYKGLLAAQSPIFHDMFSATSLRADERYDGVPVIRLFDSPVDLRHLFRVLLPKSQKDVLKDTYDLKTDFHVMSALIRLSHKYQIEDVEKRALSALCHIYPTELEEWVGSDSQIDDNDRFYAIAAVNLARLTDTPSILPSAFYHCALLQSRVLLGFTREDGSKEYLSQDDLGRCMDGMPKLIASRNTTTLGLARCIQESGAENCWRTGLCAIARRSLSNSMVMMPLHPDHETHAMSSESSRWTAHGLCDRCIAKLEKEEFKSLSILWTRLPTIFDVDGLAGTWPGTS